MICTNNNIHERYVESIVSLDERAAYTDRMYPAQNCARRARMRLHSPKYFYGNPTSKFLNHNNTFKFFDNRANISVGSRLEVMGSMEALPAGARRCLEESSGTITPCL